MTVDQTNDWLTVTVQPLNYDIQLPMTLKIP